MPKVIFITGNENKYREVEFVLSKFNIEVFMENKFRKIELQSDNLEEIAKKSIEYISQILKPSKDAYYVVEDDGLFIEALNGFPGPYSAYVYKTIGLKGILKLMEGVENRTAYFISILGVLCPDGQIRLFKGIVKGVISSEIKGIHGFGYDPIFIPEGYDKTFAEMKLEEKCEISHRARAFQELAKYILSTFKH